MNKNVFDRKQLVREREIKRGGRTHEHVENEGVGKKEGFGVGMDGG